MNIHFCDLCNESVPQSDLDRGAALFVKGRVVCSRCNLLMHGEHPTGPGTAGPFVEGLGASDPSWTAEAPSPALITPLAAAGFPQGAQAHMRVHSRSRGGAGIALGVVALLGLAAGGVWLFDRGEQAAREGFLRHQALDERIGGLSQDSGRELARLQEQSDELRRSLEADRALAQTRHEAALGWIEKQTRGTEEGLAGIVKRLGSLESSLDGLQLREHALARLQEKVGEIEGQLEELGRVLADLVDEQAARQAQGAPPRGIGGLDGAAQPAWVGLVAQLESPEDGDRWQAVVALGESRDPAVVQYLIPVLKDKDIFVRMATARMLGELGAPQAVSPLIDALEDPEGPVREAVYLALKDITQRDLPFDSLSEDSVERAKRIKAWRDWWEKEKQRYGL